MSASVLYGFLRESWHHADHVANFDWMGHRFWTRRSGCEFLFKRDAPDSLVWGAIFTEQLLDSGADVAELRAHFVEGWRAGRAARLLALPDPFAAREPVLVGVNRDKFWFSMNMNAYYTETTHSAKWSGDLWEMSPAELAESLAHEWNDADSHPRRAWEWHRLSSEEKSWSQLLWQRGSRRELENLVRSMAHSDPELWLERDYWGINFKFFPNGDARVESVRAHSILRAPSERIVRLSQLFLQHNRAILQRPPLLPALTPARSFSPDSYAFISLFYSPPTSMHEKLEAQLWLREWLTDKVSATEIEGLVPRS